MSLRLGELYVPPSWELFLILCAAPVIGVATLFQFGLYRLVTRYHRRAGRPSDPGRGGRFGRCCGRSLVLLSGVQAGEVADFSGVQVVPRSVFILYPILGTAFVWGTRQAAGWLLKSGGIELPDARARESQERADLRRRRRPACSCSKPCAAPPPTFPSVSWTRARRCGARRSPASRSIAPSAWPGSSQRHDVERGAAGHAQGPAPASGRRR